jgi:leader peptidase (prepilin peptidase)/N-methyltransferase
MLSDIPYSLVVAYAVALGLVFGSFLNVVVYRVPRGMSVLHPGSRCPSCGAKIRFYDNIPVLSWLVLRGKARCCGTPISIRYPVVELLAGLLGWAVLERVVMDLPGDTPLWQVVAVFGLHLALGLGLIAAALIDLSHMVLPDAITLGGTALGVLSVPLRPEASWQDTLVGAAVGFSIVWLPFDVLHRLLRGRPGMGLGDAKLVMLAGAWFGWVGAVVVLLAGAVQGTVAAIALLVVHGRIEEPEVVQQERAELHEALQTAEGEEREALLREIERDPVASEPDSSWRKARMPFGPFLVLAALEYQLFGEVIVNGYLDFVGW